MKLKRLPINFCRYLTTLILLISFVCSAEIYAQNRGTVKGTVTDEITHEPLIGANVFISQLNIGAATDTDANNRAGNCQE